MHNAKKLACIAGLILMTSCGAYFNQPFEMEAARIGESSKSTKKLLDLPKSATQLEVAVYNFSDQTGQFKAVEGGSTFSTAVTQGATTMLIQALDESGWFKPIERENLQNLQTERNIIRNTKQEYIKNLNPNEPALPPLLYAGLLLEGGIVSYDTNIITGGIGVRYFGLGGSARYRQDRITIYLRAVSTKNGEILKTIYVSKTILSQALDANFFRFVKFQRLLEAETGITQNEPVQIAVKDAIEKAVYDLIMEGIIDKYWGASGGTKVNDSLVANYREEKFIARNTDLFDRFNTEDNNKNYLNISGGTSLVDGDLVPNKLGLLARIGLEKKITHKFSLELAGSVFELTNGDSFSNRFASVDLNAKMYLLPNDEFGPYIYGGPGGVFSLKGDGVLPVTSGAVDELKTFFPKLQYGGGLFYRISPKLRANVFATHNIVLDDALDGVEQGRRDDFYFNFGLGIQYGFGSKNKSRKVKDVTLENTTSNE